MTDYPPELDTDDSEALAAYIERRYPTEELRMCDTETIHFAYWDVSHRSVSSEFLDHIQAAGYRVLHAGRATVPRRGTQRAWVECRKHEPGENETTDENSEFTIAPGGAYIGTIAESADGNNEFTLTCSKCEDEFTPDEARTIVISGPGEARYTCPWCGHGTDGLPPVFNEE
jgi:DNA-directed RNA polymerase subunit RPC12/RpoP